MVRDRKVGKNDRPSLREACRAIYGRRPGPWGAVQTFYYHVRMGQCQGKGGPYLDKFDAFDHF